MSGDIGIRYERVNDVLVFYPTLEELIDFPSLLSAIERVGGRKDGGVILRCPYLKRREVHRGMRTEDLLTQTFKV